MVDDVEAAQAQALLSELYGHVSEISPRLEAADERNRRAHSRGASRRDPVAGALRRDLYEAHRLIDRIHRRFPATLPAERSGRSAG